MFSGKSVMTTAMIDSGAAGNFIDSYFAQSRLIPLIPCESLLAVAVLDGRPLGAGYVHFTTGYVTLLMGSLHTETIQLFLIQSPNHPIILGLPWLQEHNPQISWIDRQITYWSDNCQ